MLRFLAIFLIFNAVSCQNRKIESLVSPPPKTTQHNKAFFQGEYSLNHSLLNRTRPLRKFKVESYFLKGHFNWAKNELEATLEISLKTTASHLKEILLDSSVTSISKITTNEGVLLPFKESVDDSLLTINLESLAPETRAKNLTLNIEYITSANVDKNREKSSLNTVLIRVGDPIQARVAYTHSEPTGTPQWMPCVDDPSSRAKFSIELSMPKDETMISNGALVSDKITANQRVMHYRSDSLLPTYLMAFTQGQFDVTSIDLKGLPLSIATRKGLSIDKKGLLNELSRQMQFFERKLGPYPFEKYTVVILPDFEAEGIEHAGITFQSESHTTDSNLIDDISLSAHELAHHWFGNLVSIETWDDLWIKEGMATLLAEEALRPFLDQNHSNRLLASQFYVANGDAIVDKSVEPEDKYNSGPYGKAAWLLTQIRFTLGEEKFWSCLQGVLKEYAWKPINTDKFLDAFSTHLDPSTLSAVRTALEAKKLPSVNAVDEAGKIKLSLEDLDHALINPIKLRIFSSNGNFKEDILTPANTFILDTNTDFLVFVPEDNHPTQSFLSNSPENTRKLLNQLLIPKSAASREAFLSLGGHAQEAALHTGLFNTTHEEFKNSYNRLGSDKAKYYFLETGCKNSLSENSSNHWEQLLIPIIQSPPLKGVVLDEDLLLTSCKKYTDQMGESEWKDLLLNRFQDAKIQFLSKIYLSNLKSYEYWFQLTQTASRIRTRSIALKHLLLHLKPGNGLEPLSEAELIKWQTLFNSILQNNDTSEMLKPAIEGVVLSKDRSAIKFLSNLIKLPRPNIWKAALCGAYQITKDSSSEWKNFVDSLGNLNELPASLEKLIQNPENCTL